MVQRLVQTQSQSIAKLYINQWFFYSAEYPNGDMYYYDNPRYCTNLYMEFKRDGTFIDYFVADYSENPDPICSEEDAFFGTFSVF